MVPTDRFFSRYDTGGNVCGSPIYIEVGRSFFSPPLIILTQQRKQGGVAMETPSAVSALRLALALISGPTFRMFAARTLKLIWPRASCLSRAGKRRVDARQPHRRTTRPRNCASMPSGTQEHPTWSKQIHTYCICCLIQCSVL